MIEYHSIYPDGQSLYHHMIDDTNNTFICMRIINETTDLMYAEFVSVNNDDAWTFPKNQTNFYELYDVKNDYY